MGVIDAVHANVILLAGLAAIAAPPAAEGQVASALLREGDLVLPGETVTAINNTAVNHVGGYSCTLTSMGTSTASRIWGNAAGGPGALMRSEATIGDLEQTSFESFFGMGDAGQLGYSAVSNQAGGPSGLDGCWLDQRQSAR